MIDLVKKVTESLQAKVQLMVGRAVLAVISDAGPIQTAQAHLLAEEDHDDAERVQEYGFTSVPLPGAEAVLVFVGGNRDHGLIVATDDRRYRPSGLQGGEVCLYTDEGDQIILQRGRVISVTAGASVEVTAGASATVTAPQINAVASVKVRMETPLLEVTGEIRDLCDINPRTISDMRDIYNTHTHDENDVSGPTDQPNETM